MSWVVILFLEFPLINTSSFSILLPDSRVVWGSYVPTDALVAQKEIISELRV